MRAPASILWLFIEQGIVLGTNIDKDSNKRHIKIVPPIGELISSCEEKETQSK